MINLKIYNLHNKTFTPMEQNLPGAIQLWVLFTKLQWHYKGMLSAIEDHGLPYDIVFKYRGIEDPIIGIVIAEDASPTDASFNLQAGAA